MFDLGVVCFGLWRGTTLELTRVFYEVLHSKLFKDKQLTYIAVCFIVEVDVHSKHMSVQCTFGRGVSINRGAEPGRAEHQAVQNPLYSPSAFKIDGTIAFETRYS